MIRLRKNSRYFVLHAGCNYLQSCRRGGRLLLSVDLAKFTAGATDLVALEGELMGNSDSRIASGGMYTKLGRRQLETQLSRARVYMLETEHFMTCHAKWT